MSRNLLVCTLQWEGSVRHGCKLLNSQNAIGGGIAVNKYIFVGRNVDGNNIHCMLVLIKRNTYATARTWTNMCSVHPFIQVF